MFERYITDVLTNHFGHILENVDSDKMRLSAWDGELTLEDVAIKTTALDTILRGPENCPVEIAYGHIGAFRVKIPWSLLSGLISGSGNDQNPSVDTTGTSTAISVVLTDVDILITPRQRIMVVENENHFRNDIHENDVNESENHKLQTNSELTLKERRAKKERKVQSLLDANLLKRVTESSIAAETQNEKGSWAAWLQDKLAEVLSNLSITVKNIHIRYEDPGTSMGFEWRVFRYHENSKTDLENQHNKSSFISKASDSNQMDVRMSSGKIVVSNHQVHDDRNLEPRRFRPAFGVGVTLKEFSVQSTTAPKKQQQSTVDESIKDHDSSMISDDTMNSIGSATSASSSYAGVSASVAGDSTIRRQHKRAAAIDLAIYWDSASALICTKAMRQFQSHWRDHKREVRKESFEFYRTCFSILNERPLSQLSSVKIRTKHSYLLDPVSPSVDLTLVSKLPDKSLIKQLDKVTGHESDGEFSEAQNSKAMGSNYYRIPPSSVKIELPPCTFTLSRSTLEDTVYLRKSLSVWTDARKTLVSESALRRILKLRPTEAATQDPVGWWKYAFEATKVLSRASLSSDADEIFEVDVNSETGIRTANVILETQEQKKRDQKRTNPLTRRKGWIGLVEAVSRRRKYVKLYKIILEPPLSSTNESIQANELQRNRQKEAHEKLLKMEDELLAREMVAFRIHTYEDMKKQGDFDNNKKKTICDQQERMQTTIISTNGTNDERNEQSIGRWATWIGRGKHFSSENGGANSNFVMEDKIECSENREKQHLMLKGETDEQMLSIEHRRWMMNEMKQALDRERSNIQNQVREGLRKPSALRMSKSIPLAGDISINDSNPVVWTASLICRKFAIQINDQQTTSSTFGNHSSAVPVIRMSSAWVQDQSWFHDGSWNVDISLASMEVIDLISGRGKRSNSRYVSTLLGSNSRPGKIDTEYIVINGIRYHRNMSVKINRRLHWSVPIEWLHQESNVDRGSTTSVQIRVLPMEIIYSALPMEKVKRVFLTVKTPEIVDDYHKVLGVAKSWRNKQKEKLLETLAHKNKQIVVDIDIAAPELLIPEDIYRPDSPMLAINFGRFQAFNDDHRLDTKKIGDFDDQWRVLVSNIQVQSTSMASYHTHSLLGVSHKQLVEAFSIDFLVSTKFITNVDQNDGKESRISISATLPRLAFNITSSAIRLISRLDLNFSKQKGEKQGEAFLYDASSGIYGRSDFPATREDVKVEKMYTNRKPERNRNRNANKSRIFKLDFSAPVITLKLENDVDGRNYLAGRGEHSTPILDVALRNIRGSFFHELTGSGHLITKFEAKLRSLGVIDLYQGAGKEFAFLMSSVPQSNLADEISIDNGCYWDVVHANHDANEVYGDSEDLVTVEYSSTILPATESDDHGKELSNDDPDRISLWFHELYIEWNPETLAAIHVAMSTTSVEECNSQNSDDSYIESAFPSGDDESSTEDEFFDALEEIDHPSDSDSDSVRPISEISTSTDDLAALGTSLSNSLMQTSPLSPTIGGGGLLGQGRFSVSPGSRSSFGFGQFHSARMYESGYFEAVPLPKLEIDAARSNDKRMARKKEIIFKLSKLRVSFNKETRCRKVIVAQMDRTFVSYSTKVTGGSRIQMSLGNLVFVDPAHEENKTLYGQILGLQTKSKGVDENSFSSLLEMEIIMNPRVKNFSSLIHDSKSNTVTIDREHGKVEGSNCCVTAKFSPMRFVLIEQLWMEIMDYFFQGIISTEVLGGQKESSSDNRLELVGLKQVNSNFAYGSDAEGISFTRFDISLDSPVIIFPVAYSSPDYLRMKLSKIHLSNEYDGEIVRDESFGTKGIPSHRMQWFNNCRVSLNDLRLYSWTGRELGRNPVIACVSLRWPTGPLAPLIIPKWHVKCDFDTLDISLCRSDYALLQNILSYNIGEPSRHMDEWSVLQTLPQNVLKEFMQKIIVHYGYDQKNVAPTTYDLKLSVPSLRVRFLETDSGESIPLAIARCFDLKWQMRKESDLIVKQNVTCGIDLVRPIRENSGFETLMTISKDNSDFDGEKENSDRTQPDFNYSSTSVPTGDNVKTIHIFDPCIYLVLPAWKRFSAFFNSLSPPIFLGEKEIGSSIQVGDRWYRIGDDDSRPSNPHTSSGMGNEGRQTFSWIPGKPISAVSLGLSSNLPPAKSLPTLQVKLLLTWPRIILSSVTMDDNPTRLILRMNHVEFLQTAEGRKFEKTRSLFFHDVEVYTSSQKSSTRSISKDNEHNSLIRPWSLSAVAKTPDGEDIGDFKKNIYKISCDVLRARAAYSDMSIAVDVILSVFHTAKEASSVIADDDLPQYSISNRSFDSSDKFLVKSGTNKDEDEEELHSTKPFSVIYDVQCDGFELKVADDSGRHFSGSQDLAILSIGKTLFSRHESQNGTTSMKLWLDCLDLFDCLQPMNSPFRNAASSQPKVMGIEHSLKYNVSKDSDKENNIHVDTLRKMSWNDFSTKFDGSRNFVISQSFWKRMKETSSRCSHFLWGEGGEGPTPGLIESACKFTEGSYQEYDVKFSKFAVQWNPSTVIAMQRFLGRLRKESKLIAGQVFHKQFDNIINGSKMDEKRQIDADSDLSGSSSLIRANIEIDSLTVCMNKEHQHRRLLELTLTSCNVVMGSSEQGITIEGKIDDLSAFDNDNYATGIIDQDSITKKNRKVLSVLTDDSAEKSGKFLQIYYQTFTDKSESTSKAKVPKWIRSKLPSLDDIDDFLSLTVAATRFTYLKERTDELLDYLSNGLPGKGMGATSRAAKGFISRRIQTRSFLQLQVNSPQIYMPQHEMAEQGLGLKLGDVNVQSWFEEATPSTTISIDSEWWRVLSLKLSGFSCGIIRSGSSFDSLSSATNPIDLDILLRKPTIKGRTLSIRGSMSSFEVALHYEDFSLLRAVAKDNIGRHVNTDKWDNVEKAYWLENEDVDQGKGIQGTTSTDGEVSNKVAYSSNARFVRYGKSGKKGIKHADERSFQSDIGQSENISTNILDIRFDLAGVALKLRRDDLPEGIMGDDDLAGAFHYDIVLLRVGVVELLTTANTTGDISFNLSLFRVGLFDLGDSGRLMRQRYYYSLPSSHMSRRKRKMAVPQPCPFVVLAEGYLSANHDDAIVRDESDLDGPEFVISIDICSASSTNGFAPHSETALPPDTKVTVAKVVINYLSLNAIIQPFQEIADFFSCAWPIRSEISPQPELSDKSEPHATGKKKQADNDEIHDSLRGFQLKVVAHYPRIFFLADESDLNSRALVLKGLAVANISTVSKKEVSGPKGLASVDIQQITSIGAQLHGLETYINPDVSIALRFRQRHSEMVGREFSPSFNPFSEDGSKDKADTLGVALIQPVTIGIEYIQIERDLFPTRRSLQVNIDPVSTMLSFEDLQLVEVVLKRWSSDKGKRPTNSKDSSSGSTTMKNLVQEKTFQFQVVFNTARLGLGLRTDDSHVVVNTIQNPSYERQINQGDILVSVGDESVVNEPLEHIVKILARSGRPVRVGFERLVTPSDSQWDEEKNSKSASSLSNMDRNEDIVDGYPISCYSLHFRSGMQLGLAFEKSVCGKFPVVSKLLPSIDEAVVLSGSMDEVDSEQIEVIESVLHSEHRRLPRVGAVVVAVDDVPVEELGAEEVWQVLSKMEASEVHQGFIGSDLTSYGTLSLTFQETHSSTWGKIDTMEVSLAGMALSFIDDLNGRDMPLFRGKLSSVGIHIERGLGINAHILDNTIPSLLTPLSSDSDDENSDVILTTDQVHDIQTESIVSFSAISICSVDYFRPRVSFWEPLLEPSQLFFHFEKQDGSAEANRPAQVAIEVSDRLLHDHFTRDNFIQNNHFGEAHMVSINVTDAAAEVLVEALTRWKDWRENLFRLSEDVDIEYADELVVEEERNPTGSFVSSMRGANEQQVHFDGVVMEDNQQRLAQRTAAKKAAQGALIFAQKRGAETSKKSDSAKPFIFRNRTGISIAFVQQGCGLQTHDFSWKASREFREGSSIAATVGEYNGLEEYAQESITELADQEDAKFSMDLIDENFGEELSQRRSTRQYANKIRSYEGRYPDLMVAIQAVAGVLVEPITNLQVFKVGSCIRHLTVKKDTGSFKGSDSTLNSIQVIWNVEIEDNRRILTLSTAVRVVSAGLSMPIEIGFQHAGNDEESDLISERIINAIGVARSGYPFYMPLWLALKLEPVSVYVRPASTSTAEHSWSESSVLRFGLCGEDRLIPDSRRLEASATGKWTWEVKFSDFRCICCHSESDGKYPTWFSVFGSSSTSPENLLSVHTRDKLKASDIQVYDPGTSEVLSITIDSGFTIRNMLPTMIEMEVIQEDELENQSDTNNKIATHFSFDGIEPDVSKFDTLKAGECIEVFEANFSAAAPKLRIRHQNLKGWSTWALLKLNETLASDDYETDENEITTSEFSTPSQTNVQIPGGDFGIPMTFGVRIEPKVTNDDVRRGHVYGVEVIIYAELWIRNITSLPLNFGCPAYQIYEADQTLTKNSFDDSIKKFAAESALMELTSLLEVGDKGTALNQKVANEGFDRSHLIESLPGQECHELTEEVFEYVEIESSIVKRKWWASESYNGYHKQIFDVGDTGANWKWLDEKWAIDCSGGAKPSVGGWESCKNLCTTNGSFGGKREFHPSDGFRRRRFFRRRSGCLDSCKKSTAMELHSQNSGFPLSGHMGGIQAFHQPLMDVFSREQKIIQQSGRKENPKSLGQRKAFDDKLKIAIRCGDGSWSSPAEISSTGTCFGVIRALASRWPRLTQRYGDASQSDFVKNLSIKRNSYSVENPTQSCNFEPGCLASDQYEFCYTVSDIDGEWGEFSRSMEVSPRFLIRNDSKTVHMKVKQTGAPNLTCVSLSPGEASPFYWADFRLPKLVSVVPFDSAGKDNDKYKWSGGFDLCNLGMTPVRIRSEKTYFNAGMNSSMVTSIRVLVEVRPGTGGHGINVSLREEAADGDGALFRIENLSPFPIWLSQDGVLANPISLKRNTSDSTSLVDGDLMQPNSKSTFALDVPYRQGKYAHRKEASLSELMHVRAALAPLSSRVGIESVKVIGLASMGETIRLNPMKIPSKCTSKGQDLLQNIRILGVVATDGPTRVLRFCLMTYSRIDLGSRVTIPDTSYVAMTQSLPDKSLITSSHRDYSEEITAGINEALTLATMGKIPTEVEAKRNALFVELNSNMEGDVDLPDGGASDRVFSLRLEFSGFLFSLVDSAPSEIALASLRNVNALARWNNLRSTDATLLLSVGWLQIDNHIPSAPFKVAVRPDVSTQQLDERGPESSPLLVVAVAFAPEHKSKIVVLRSATIAPRDLVIALDLAFLVRLQRFFMGLQDHLRKRQHEVNLGLQSTIRDGNMSEQKKTIPFPNFISPERQLEQIAAFNENKKMYFQGLTILPTNIKLSVAPAKALTSDQANLEGKETAAIHTAVRKGDVLVGGKSHGALGVRVGRKNRTPLAVVRGVFKSIVVDALLRLSGASLNFHGVFLRNYIATSTQLSTYLAAHYLSSLKYNVPALLGSLSAIGNPLGLIRGIGDGVSDFVTEPIQGFKRALKELDPGYAVDGVARGTESLARHTVGGIADSASLLMETFSKYMAVVTLDRRYAQKRDRRKSLRMKSDAKVTLVGGVESGFLNLVQGFREGVTGVVRAPIRGAEKRGLEGFAKGLGKGLLGLLVKPIIGITDAATDVMIGVKNTVEYKETQRQNLALLRNQFRPRRPMYGRDKVLRPYSMEDSAAATLMLKTRCAGENYLSHLEMNDRVALLSVKRLIILGPKGEEQLALKFKHVHRLEVRSIRQEDGITEGWGIIVVLNTPRRNGSDVEVISCSSEQEAIDLCMLIQRGVDLVSLDSVQET